MYETESAYVMVLGSDRYLNSGCLYEYVFT
jgi:hypothetical protein